MREEGGLLAGAEVGVELECQLGAEKADWYVLTRFARPEVDLVGSPGRINYD